MTIKLLKEIRRCTACAEFLPHSPRPVLNFSTQSRIVIIGQAPGIKVHNSGVPWDDASGLRLRKWLNVSVDEFYDPNNFAIVPMGFCFPGNDGKSDRPPRPECAELWMSKILSRLKNKKLTLLVGQYSQKYFLDKTKKKTLTESVKSYQDYLPDYFVLPHPSPRNNIWLKKNPWFEKNNVVDLQKRIRLLLD
ncbi:MAG: uracil-DNA glycosylase [Gammaproteobacteria bacterium]|jgi:uracil-DNA glycosylase